MELTLVLTMFPQIVAKTQEVACWIIQLDGASSWGLVAHLATGPTVTFAYGAWSSARPPMAGHDALESHVALESCC